MAERVAVQELPGLLAAGPVTLMVPDMADPCGSRRIARPVRAAVAADVWDTEHERMTVGRWKVFFGGEHAYPMIMVTAGDHRYEVTGEKPGTPGPCGACAALAARESVPVAAAADTPDLRAEAQERGYDQGRDHANYVDNVAGGVDMGWTVPDRFASVATYYRAAFEDGMASYRDEDEG